MKVALIGSRSITECDIEKYLPHGTDEIITGGARGIDTCAKMYANEHKIKLTEHLPDYKRYGKGAPLRRNIEIIEESDAVVAIWDGISRGTGHVINECIKRGKPITVHTVSISVPSNQHE